MRALTAAALLALAGCANLGQVTGANTPALQAAAARYPTLILGGNVYAADGSQVPRACPASGARVEQKGGPTTEYLGADPANPDLCLMRVEGQTLRGWYGIWLTDWPGAEFGGPGLGKLMHGRSGDVVAFETNPQPGFDFYDLIRNDGVEDIELLGTVYRTVKLSHYREGAGGNAYRSVSTVWKDVPTGMIIFATYNHIAGKPEIDDPLTPTAIIPSSTPAGR